jgi:WD40 repeat protein
MMQADKPAAATAPIAGPTEFPFDAFASYANYPDRAVVRDVEAFLESLHRNRLVEPQYRRALELCVDGSDFRIPRALTEHAEGGEPGDAVFGLIVAHMQRCRLFVLFVGPESCRHPWVNREVEWWLENRGEDSLLVAVTHGHNPQAERELTFPAAVRARKLDQRVWFDLRGFSARVRRDAAAVRDYQEERLRLAAAIMGPEVSANDLLKGWKLAATKLRRRNALLGGVAAAAAVGAVATAGWALTRSAESNKEARASDWALASRQIGEADSTRMLDTLALAASSLAERPVPQGYLAILKAMQTLPRHVRTIVHDEQAKAVDVVRFVAGDRLIVSAGYSAQLRFADAATGALVASLPLSGRAMDLAEHPSKPMLAVSTQTGFDLVTYERNASHPAPVLLGQVRIGERVPAITFSPTGSELIVGAFNGELMRYEVGSARTQDWQPVERRRLLDRIGAKVGIRGFAVDPNARRLAIAGITGEIYCLDLNRWGSPPAVARYPSEIFGFAASPQGGKALGGDADGGSFLLDIARCHVVDRATPDIAPGTVVRDLTGRIRIAPRLERGRLQVAFSRDGGLVAIGSLDGTVKILTADRRALSHLIVHRGMARAVAFAAAGKFVAVGTGGGRVELWDIGDTVEAWRAAGVETFAVDPKGRWLAVAGDDGLLRILSADEGRPLAAERQSGGTHPGSDIAALAVTADGTRVAARVVASTSAPVWKVASDRGSGNLEPPDHLQHPNEADHVAVVSALAPVPDSTKLVTAERYQGKSVRLWDTEKQAQLASAEMPEEISAVAASRDLVAAVAKGGLIRVFTTPSLAEKATIQLEAGADAFALAPDGAHLFYSWGGSSSGACLCNLSERGSGSGSGLRRLLRRLTVFSDDPDSPSSAGCGEIVDPAQCRRLELNRRPIKALFSPRGDAIAVAVAGVEHDDGGLLLMREVAAWRPTTLALAGRIQSMAFSGDGGLLAAGGMARAIGVWEVGTAALLAELPLTNPLREVAFLEGQGNRVVSLDGVELGVLRVWDWRPEYLIEAACRRWPVDYTPTVNPTLPPPLSRGRICRAVPAGSFGRAESPAR